MRPLPEDIRSKLREALVAADERFSFDPIALVNNMDRDQSEIYVSYIRESAPKASAPDDFIILALTPLVHLVDAAERERLEIEILDAWGTGRVSETVGTAFSDECRKAHGERVAHSRGIDLPPSAPHAYAPRVSVEDVATRVDLARRFLDRKCERLTTTLRVTDFGYPWGNGYLLGVLDAARQHVLGNMPPKAEDYAAAVVILGSIHGDIKGASVLRIAMQAQEVGDQEFMRGMRTGGTEALSFFRGASAGASFEPPPAKEAGIIASLRRWFSNDR